MVCKPELRRCNRLARESFCSRIRLAQPLLPVPVAHPHCTYKQLYTHWDRQFVSKFCTVQYGVTAALEHGQKAKETVIINGPMCQLAGINALRVKGQIRNGLGIALPFFCKLL